jgi:hypothetical protein
MTDQTAPEPTMEEILASIRRIITEEDPPVDSGAPHAVAAPESAEEAPPEETESTISISAARAPWNGDMPVKESEPESISEPSLATPEPAASPSVAYTPPPAEPSVFAPPDPTPPAYLPAAPSAQSLTPAPSAAPDISLVSARASAETASAFERLSAAVKVTPKESSIMLPEPGRTLEDLTRELIRPMLQSWLDEHLPEIVRQQVEEEVARIARGRAG